MSTFIMASPQNAQDFCKEVAAKKDTLGDISKAIIAVSSPMALIGSLLGKLGTNTKSVDVIKNNIQNEVSSTTVSKIENKCRNSATVNQYNVVDNSECVRLLGCGSTGMVNLYTALNSNTWSSAQWKQDTVTAFNTQCSALLNNTNINKQVNTYTGQQNCTIDGVLTILSAATLDSSLMAILQKTQEAKGLLASTDSSTKTCNNISNKASVSNYTDTFQKCSNNLNLNQGNIAKCRGGNNDQSSTYEQLQKCMLSSKVAVDSSVASKAAATSDMNLQQKATSDLNGALMAIAFIILAAAGAYALVTFGPGMAKKQQLAASTAAPAAAPAVSRRAGSLPLPPSALRPPLPATLNGPDFTLRPPLPPR